jgi:hypothetical protein
MTTLFDTIKNLTLLALQRGESFSTILTNAQATNDARGDTLCTDAVVAANREYLKPTITIDLGAQAAYARANSKANPSMWLAKKGHRSIEPAGSRRDDLGDVLWGRN